MNAKREKKKQRWRAFLSGAAVGLCNGFFGGGGGMIAVPLLKGAFSVSEKKAHATAIFLILPLSLVSGLIYATFGAFPGRAGVFTAAGVTVGGAIGALLLGKIKEDAAFWLFTCAMAFSGGYLLLL